MPNFTEISLTTVENGVHTPITGKGLLPYVNALNKIVGVTEYLAREAAKHKGEPIPPQTIELNVDEKGREYGFRIMQNKLVLAGFWGEDHTRDSDIVAFGAEFPTIYMSITEAGTPKPNGNLSALKNYTRRDYLEGECVATWVPEPIVWIQRGY